MFRWFRNSIPVKAGLGVALIAALTLASTLSGLTIAWLSKDDAAAINTAGSLRMATYRLSWKLEAAATAAEIQTLGSDLESRLHSEELSTVLGRGHGQQVSHAYEELLARWERQLQPALEAGDAALFQRNADDFVGQLDRFVQLLQEDSEGKQGWQQAIQGTALLVIVLVLMIGMYELQGGVLVPLQELVAVTQRFRGGDLAARVSYRSPDELGQVAQSFNEMADAIEQSHQDLESRVAQKTARLAQANAALQLLYEGSRRIANQPSSIESLEQLIDSFQSHLPGLQLTLCLQGGPSSPTQQLIALHGDQIREICSPRDCAGCVNRNQPQSMVCPVISQRTELGELRAVFADGRAAQPWEWELIQALANLVGTALSLERQREQEHRLLLFEERATIARELHDSLAQALSYMKLQVSRLQTLINRGEPPEKLQGVAEEIRDGLNNAYRQLRELLITFRLKIQEGGLDQALKDTVAEFSERGEFQGHLALQSLAFTLSANEQIHLLQIVREALSNCVRHARASQVWVSLRQQVDAVELLVEDNGKGLPGHFDQRHHHGLNIMRERASHLRGELAVEPRAEGGTRVRVQFQPEFLHSHDRSNET